MRWRKIGFWSLLVALGIVALGVAWLWTADLGVFKPRIERWVTETTGRELRIGDLSIDIGDRSFVVVRDLTFANAEWADSRPMVSVGRAELEIDLWSIFSPPLIIENVEISDASVHLAGRADGRPNWSLEIPTPKERSDAEADDGLAVLLRNVLIQNIELVYEDPERSAPLELAIRSATQRLREDNYLDVRARGALSGRRVEVTGELGTWEALLAQRDIRYDLSGQFDTFSVASSGHIDDLVSPRQPTMVFEANGPDIDDLTRMLGLGEDGTGSIELAGELSVTDSGDSRLVLEGNLGEALIDTRASVRSLADLSVIDAEIRASGPDLGQVLRLFGVPRVRKAPFQLEADIEREGPRVEISRAEMLFGDARFVVAAELPRFPALDEGNLTLKLTGTDLARFRRLTGLPGAASGPFSLDAGLSMDDAEREFFEISLETSLGRIVAAGEVRGGQSYLGTTAELDVEIFDARATADAWELDLGALPASPMTASGAFEYVDGAIRTTRPMTASAGDLALSAEGRLALSAGAVGSDFMLQVGGGRLTLVTDPFTQSAFIPPEAFSATGRLLIETGGIRLDNLSGNLGTVNVGANASIRFAPRIAGSAISFSATGDALEEALAYLPKLEIRPGPFELGGRIRFAKDALHLEELRLERPSAKLTGNLSIGLPADRKWLKVDLKGKSADARILLAAIKDFEAARAPLSIDLSAERNGDTLRADRLHIDMADARLAASGTLDFSEQVDSTRFRFEADLPSLARLGTFRGRGFHDQAVVFSGIIDGNRGELRLEDARLTIADSDVGGSVRLNVAGTRPTLRVDVRSERLSVQPLLVPPDDDEPRPAPPEPDGRLIPDVSIPFDALATIDTYLEVGIGVLERGDLHLRDLVLKATAIDGVVEVSDLSLHARSGFLRSRAMLAPGNDKGRAKLEVISDDLAFGLTRTNTDLAMTGRMRVNLEATGNDLRALAGSSSGILLFETTGGVIPNNRLMQLLYGDVLDEILTTINPFMKSQPFTNFECIIVPVEVTDGRLVTNEAAYVRTGKLNMTIKPDINLKNERIDINIRSTPRKILTISAAELINPYIKIIGTMADPSLAVDEQGVLVSGGAAVATGGLSVLAKAAWDRLSRSGDPCASAREEAEETLGDRFPDIAPLDPLPKLPLAGNP